MRNLELVTERTTCSRIIAKKLEKDLTISAEKAAELNEVLVVMEDFSTEQLGAKIKEYGITAPDTKNPLSDPFNLMFQTSIGPSGLIPGIEVVKINRQGFEKRVVSQDLQLWLSNVSFCFYNIPIRINYAKYQFYALVSRIHHFLMGSLFFLPVLEDM